MPNYGQCHAKSANLFPKVDSGVTNGQYFPRKWTAVCENQNSNIDSRLCHIGGSEFFLSRQLPNWFLWIKSLFNQFKFSFMPAEIDKTFDASSMPAEIDKTFDAIGL